MSNTKVLMPLPNRDFDPTEAALSWKIMHDAGYDVIFATESGKPSCADAMMISGEGLDLWGFIPGLKKLTLVGRMLRARKDARDAYRQLQFDANFLNPILFSALKPQDFDGLFMPGGHAPPMRQYLESEVLQSFVGDFFDFEVEGQQGVTHKPVAAVCHGVLALARSTSKKSGRSVLYGRKTTALTWSQELSAQNLTKFTRFWDPLYYRTYSESADEPKGYWSVEHEIKRSLKSDDDFINVAKDTPNYFRKTANIARDTLEDDTPSWVVRDGNYVSARWPGDVCSFTKSFMELL